MSLLCKTEKVLCHLSFKVNVLRYNGKNMGSGFLFPLDLLFNNHVKFLSCSSLSRRPENLVNGSQVLVNSKMKIKPVSKGHFSTKCLFLSFPLLLMFCKFQNISTTNFYHNSKSFEVKVPIHCNGKTKLILNWHSHSALRILSTD